MMSMNSAYVEELYFDFLRDPESISSEWKTFFQNYTPEKSLPVTPRNGAKAQAISEVVSPSNANRLPALGPDDSLVPLSSIGGKIAENMEASLRVPTATSVRNAPVKALEENRRIANTVLTKKRRSKLSFTHILAWAIVKAAEKFPNMRNSY